MPELDPPSHEEILAAAAHLKEYAREIVYAFKDGAGNPSAPLTAELAVAAIWRKVDQAFTDSYAKALCGTLHFRTEVEQGVKPPTFGNVVTCRCLGAAGTDVQVYYVVVKADSYEKATKIVHDLVKDGLRVRDWEYYGG